MSTNKKNWTDGEALTTVELQRVATIAAGMDDRAWEALFTPGSVQKKIVPLSEESTTLNPRLLIIPGVTNGAARLQPCLLIAGGSGLPNHINMSAKLETAVDSAQLGANSSGSTRYDLIYATVAYATSATGSRKVKDVGTGITSTQSLTLEKAPQVTVTVLPNVNNASPTATMPADAVDGSSYNFPLAMVTVANGYVAGTAITQSMVTQLWTGSWLQTQRRRSVKPMGIFFGAAAEKINCSITKMTRGAERFGAGERFFGIFGVLPTTGSSLATGVVIDDTIDWRNRIIWGTFSYLRKSANATLEGSAGVQAASARTISGTNPVLAAHAGLPPSWSGAGNVGVGSLEYSDTVNSGLVTIGVNAAGQMVLWQNGVPLLDTVNGDMLCLILEATDQLLTGL